MTEGTEDVVRLGWRDLSRGTRESLMGKLVGLWGAPGDQEAFESMALDKQHALLLILSRMRAKDLWQVVRRVDNAYGLGGVGIDFTAWPKIEATLSRRKDFTRLFAKRKAVSGGFYEKGRPEAALHFLYREGTPRQWHVHFDLYSPVQSFASVLKHLRYEYMGKLRPDWRTIRQSIWVEANTQAD